MRERRPSDWKVDLGNRHALEALVRNELAAHPDLTLLSTSTAATDRLDYQLVESGDRLLEVELKAKRQPYRGWNELRPDTAEVNLFMVDELALRRIIEAGRYAFLLVRDLPQDRWAVWSTPDLILASKTRASRQLAVGTRKLKGKILLSLEDSHQFGELREAVDFIVVSCDQIDRHWSDIAPWPRPGEAIQG